MSAIKHTDLFDFDSYEAGIKKALDLSVDFGKTMDAALARIRSQQKGLIADLKQYEQILKGFNTSSSTAASGLGGLNTGISNTVRGMTELKAVAAGIASVVNLQKASISELKAEYAGIKKQLEALKPEQANYQERVAALTRRLSQVSPRIKEYNENLRNTTNTIRAAEGSYKAMQAQLGALRTRLREMPNAFDQVTGKMNKNNKEAVNLQREISKLDKVLKQADASMGIYYRNVGNYASALKGVDGTLGTMVARFISITAVLGLVKSSLDVSKRFQALDTAIQSLSSSSAEFGQNQQFLRGIAEKYGQDIFTLTGAYKGLLGATRGTNIEGLKSKQIFESIVQAGTVMKLSNEQVEGSLLAIQQMLSKGTVQAEELRGQLGERLPGAFRIFADSLGVSQEKLNDMLKQGKVLAEDALPKFAAELNKLYGPDAVGGAAALVNEQNRLNNAWNELLDSKKVTGFFSTVFSGLTRFVKDLNFTIKTNDWATFFLDANQITTNRKVAEKNAADVETYLQNFETKTEEKRTQSIQERIKKIQALQKQLTNANKVDAALIADKVQRNQQLLERQLAIQSRLEDNAAKAAKKTNDPEATAKALAAARQRVQKEQEILKSGYDLDLQNLELALAKKEISEKEYQDKKFELTSSYAGAAYAKELELGKNADQAKLNGLKELLSKEETLRLENEDRILKKLNSKRGIGQNISTIALPTENKNPFSDDVAALGDKAMKNAEAVAQAQIDAENKAFSIIQAGRDTSFKEELAHLNRLKDIRIKNKQSTAEEEYAISELQAERERELHEQTTSFIFDTLNTALSAFQDISNAKFEARISQLEQEKQKQIDAAGDNASAREKIEKAYNQKIAKEKRKQAQSDKTFALFDVGINTAQGVTKTIAEWGMPWALPFIAITLATGLVQAAAIAAKPLPAYKKGTTNAAAGLAIAGEAGRELMERNGQFHMIDKPTLLNLKGGERIYSNDETEKLAAKALAAEEQNRIIQASIITSKTSQQISRGRNDHDVANLTEALKRSGINKIPGAIRSALDDLPVHMHSYDERGYLHSITEKGQKNTYLNRRHG